MPGPCPSPEDVWSASTGLISHRFQKRLKPARCNYCLEIMFTGLRCRHCNYKCHQDCEANVPPSCGLTKHILDAYSKDKFTKLQDSNGSPTGPRSAPPRLCTTPSPRRKGTHSLGLKFTFPSLRLSNKVSSYSPVLYSVKSYDGNNVFSESSSSPGSQGTICHLDGQAMTQSVAAGDATDWIGEMQITVSPREWDIPYEELDIREKIGSGRFSTVYQGNWHGAVAIKILNIDKMEGEETLEAFRSDVLTFQKIRHENLILFMGACMKPPKLAIITSLCTGNTLYTHLHLLRDKFPLKKILMIAQQVAQGMSYLHHKDILHNDLRSKNIFLENGRAIIVDFGLVNVTRRLCSNLSRGTVYTKEHRMSIPRGWLCYLAPEILRALRLSPADYDLPFTKQSDIFAYGTVFYELLTAEWPWQTHVPETVIWLVSKGVKPSLGCVHASRELKDILVTCWTFTPDHRPAFSQLAKSLEEIPTTMNGCGHHRIRSWSQFSPE